MTAIPPARATAIFDLDGTLTDTRHRDHWLSVRPPRWDEFFAAAALDDAHPEGLAALHAAVDARCQIVYLSGRPERLRQVTLQWLRQHECADGDLLLRSDRDRSPAVQFKLRQLRRLATTRRLVLLVDDDQTVIHAVERATTLVQQTMLADWQAS